MATPIFGMQDMDPNLAIISFVIAMLFSIYYAWSSKDEETDKRKKLDKSMNFEKLEKHTTEFQKPEIISICDNKIHVAIGFGLANVILIEGQYFYLVSEAPKLKMVFCSS